MPNYTYHKCLCESIQSGVVERQAPIAERDKQKCYFCGASLVRKFEFTGSVWAPTASTGATHR